MKYKQLGKLIKSEREKRGWEQADLAKRMGVTQQTVSRWERGGSRPKRDDLSKLVDLFAGEDYEWFTKAGYDYDEPDISLSPYLPIQNLSAENFELFCRDLVQELNPDFDVYRYGAQGSTQEGIDLCAQKSTTVLDYQCKRHKQFGAADIRAAIRKTTLKAKRHHLLLSRTATSLARKEMRRHRNWMLWDREDISAKVRRLPNDVRVRLVDIYFPGKRKSFLGVESPIPWLTPEDYFSPYVNKLKTFSHGWNFVGHSRELEQLNEFESQSTSKALILSGRGGSGKSRLLLEWATSTEKKVVRFVSAGADVDAAGLETLPKGPACLVIDDAHERTDNLVILNGVARTRPDMKVILSSRPYGIGRLNADILRSGLEYDSEKIISLSDLTIDEAKGLATQVLVDATGNSATQYAQQIAEITKDCPLLTVIGSRLVGQGKIRPDQLNNDKSFREELLGRFRDVITGEVGGANSDEISDLIDFLALIQPFNPSDPKFQKSANEVLGKPADKILRNVRLLEDAGVLLRRGNFLRVVPDLLADYIRASVAYDEKSQRTTGYADRVFGKLQDDLATNLLVNISQLDWRLSIDGVQASLLAEVWSNIKEQFKRAKIFERALILERIAKISYYQPGHALDFVRLALLQPTEEVESDAARLGFGYEVVLDKIPPILRYVAYDRTYLPDALDILKVLAEKESPPTNPPQDHPIRVLQELASIEPGKPIDYNETIATHILGWLQQPPMSNFSPFDVLDTLLATEGVQEESKGYQLILKGYKVRPEAVSELRRRITDSAFDVVIKRPYSEAVRALRALDIALRYPMGIVGQHVTPDDKAAWDPEIVSVLEGLAGVVVNPDIDPYLAVEIRRMVSWHARSGSESTKAAAQAVLASIPTTLDYEVSRALFDAWGHTFDRGDLGYEEAQATLMQWRSEVADQLVKRYKGRLIELVQFLEERIKILESVQVPQRSINGVFLDSIMEVSPEFADYLGAYLLANPSSALAGAFGILVVAVAKRDRLKSMALAQEALTSGQLILARGVARALGWGMPGLELTTEEIKIMKRLATSSDPEIRHNIVWATKRFPRESATFALDILLSIDITDSADIADEFFSTLDERYGSLKIDNLTEDQLERVLQNLAKCSSLDQYHIGLFLRDFSFSHPLRTMKMLMSRVEYREANQELSGYNPLPTLLGGSGPLRFSETAQYEQVLRTVRDWAMVPTGNWGRINYGRELFKLVSAGFGDTTLKVLQEWIMSVDEHQLGNAASLLQEAPRNFVWDKQEFVVNLLDQAHRYGDICYKRVCSSLHASVIQGFRSGTPGQPFPEDIEQRNRSSAMMAQLPVGSPAYKFYRMLFEDANTKIQRRSDDDEIEKN